MKHRFVYWLTTVLLLALLASNTCFAVLAYQERQVQAERAEERQVAYEEYAQQIQATLDRQQRTITSIDVNYRADAYDPSIDRIAEQQLIAAEYQILLLQTIAQQNAQMIELLMVAGP